MSWKRFFLTCTVVYLTYQILNIVIHQVVLAEIYQGLTEVFRPQNELISKAWIGLVTSAVTVFLFCFFFTRLEKRPRPLAGLRYGVLVGILVGVSMAYENYMLYPISLTLANAWFLSSIAVTGICGTILAALTKSA